jgi:hypothetical protein
MKLKNFKNPFKMYKKWKFKKKLSKIKKPVVASLVLVLVLAGVYFLFFNPSEVMADWWDNNWHYRKAIQVTNNGSAQTDFQIKVLENYNMSADVTAGKVQSNFNDLRFTDANGKMLNYWIEDDTATSLDVWAKISSIPAGTSVVYMYYGNPNASSGKTIIGTSTFPGLSCKAILDAGNSSGDGKYWIDPSNGDSSDKEQVYCDMTNDDGGWMLVFPSMVNNVYTSTGFNVTTNEVDGNGGIRYTFTSVDTGCGTGGVRPQANITISNDYQWDRVRSKKILGPNGGASCWGTDGVAGYTGNTNLESHSSELDVVQNCVLSCSTSPFVMPPMGRCDNAAENFARFNQGSDRSFEQISRRINRSTVSGPGVGLDCQTIGLDWTIEQIYIRENNLLFSDFSTSPSTTEEKSPGPVGYWSFDEGYGTTAYDRTSNANDGTISGATWQTEDMCVNGKCLKFIAAADRVSVSNTIIPNLEAITVSMWIKPGVAPGSNYPIFFNSSGQYLYLAYHHDTDRFRVSWRDGGGIQRSLSVYGFENHNEWHYITAVLTENSQKLYVNGIEEGSNSYAGFESTSVNGATLGYYNTSYPFHGFLDEVKIYPYARTAEQIKADYNARGGATSKGTAISMGGRTSQGDFLSDGLVGYWKMDESSGNAIDSSGNGNTGTWNGTGSHYPAGKFGNGGGFNGTDDYVEFSSSIILESASLWANFNDITSTSYFLGNGSQSQGVRYDGSMFLVFNGGSNWTAVPWTKRDELVHFAVVRVDGTANYDIYINGGKIGTGYAGDGNADIAIKLLGKRYDGYQFKGIIDEVRIYNRALSDREVRQLYEWAPGPVAYYDFEEGSGTNLYDKSGNGYNSTSFVSSPVWSLGKYGGSLDFDGTDDYINIGSPMNNMKEFSISTWIKTTQQETNGTSYKIPAIMGVQHGAGFTTNDFAFLNNNGYLGWWDEFSGVYKAAYTTSSFIADGNWHYVIANRSIVGTSSIIDLYVDGIKVGSDTIANANGAIVRPIRLAYSYDIYTAFDGRLDDVRIYNYARTQKQILEDMLAHRGGGNAGPVAHWKFDEGYGTTAYDTGLGGNNGTISGATWTNDGKLGKALSFNGTSDYVDLGEDIEISPDYQGWTAIYWFKTNDATKLQHFNSAESDEFNANWLSLYNNKLAVWNRNPGYWKYGSTIIQNDIWYQAVFVCDKGGTNYRFYINGVREGGDHVDNVWSADYSSFLARYIGRYEYGGGYSRYFDGIIDEVKFYNYALTEDEIKIEYNQGKVGVMGAVSSDETMGGHSSALEYCVPGDNSYCEPPVAEWKFEEKTGNTVYDTSDNNNHGTINGMVLGEETWTQGKIGSALDFDGENDYVDFSAADIIDPSTGTIEAWIYANNWDANRMTVFSSEMGPAWADLRFVLFSNYNNSLTFSVSNGTSSITDNVNTGTILSADTWYHITGTYDGTAVKIYVNGILKDSYTTSIVPGSFTPTKTMAGWHYSNRYWNGKIDQIRIFDYARTPAQVAWDYNKGKPIAHYKMDKGEGTTIYDSSGNGNDGTLNLGSLGQTSAGSVKVSGNTAWYNGRQGKQNYSLNFDGSDDYVEVSDNSTTNWPSGITISAWVKTNVIANQGIVSKSSTSNREFHIRLGSGGKAEMWLSTNGVGPTGSTALSTDSYSTGVWHHVIGVFDNSDLTVYLDGKSGTPVNISGSIYNGTGSLNIGKWVEGGYQFNGQIDDVRIYNYALTEAQIKTLYNFGAARLGTGN